MNPSFLRVVASLCLFGALLSASWYGVRGYRAWQRRQLLSKPWVHAFQEPNQRLPKPPRIRTFGMIVGESNVAEVKAFTQARRFACQDNSVRGMMRRQRAAKVAKMQAEGKTYDAISGATWNRPSPRERNPAIRWNCEKVFATQFTDIHRPAGLFGRLLFVFDSPKHPLRHLSYQYDMHPSKALRAFRSAIAAYQAQLGTPTEQQDERPLPKIHTAPTTQSASPASLPATLASSQKPATSRNATPLAPTDSAWIAKGRKYERFRRAWRFSGLQVQVTLRSFGGWYNLSEIIEVPWPVRPDAPALLRKP